MDEFRRKLMAPVPGQAAQPDAEEVKQQMNDFTAFASAFGVSKPDQAEAGE